MTTFAAERTPRVMVTESGDPARLVALRAEWSELFDAAGSPSPFLSWEWLTTWWRHFGQRRPLRILEARAASGRLDGILVLSGRGGLVGGRRFVLLGNGVTGADGLDVLARSGRGGPVRAAMARALLDRLAAWDAVDLEDLPCGTSTIESFRAVLAPAGVQVQVEPRFVCPGLALRGSFEAHLAGVGRRETYGRRCRWFERQAGYRIEVTAEPREARSAMDDFLRLHRLRWATEGGSYGIPEGHCEEFHREMAPLLAARGWLRLYRLFMGGASIAAVYGIEVGRRFFFYQSGFDPEWSQRSPGIVLVGRTVADAYRRGLTDYDFLRGTEPYKLDWSTDRRETCAVRLRAPGLRAEAAAAADAAFRAARSLARAVAPERIWVALARARRNVTVNGFGGVPARVKG